MRRSTQIARSRLLAATDVWTGELTKAPDFFVPLHLRPYHRDALFLRIRIGSASRSSWASKAYTAPGGVTIA